MLPLRPVFAAEYEESIRCEQNPEYSEPTGNCDDECIYIMLYDHSDYHCERYDFKTMWEKYIKPMHTDIKKTFPHLKYGNQFTGSYFEWLDDASKIGLSESVWSAEQYKLSRDSNCEIIGGTWSDPLSSYLNEESAILQFLYGLESIKKYTGKEVCYYSASENTAWAYFPQILMDFGFKGAMLPVHWQVMGTSPSYMADYGIWRGPDGSGIPTIPALAGDNMRIWYKGMIRPQAEFLNFIKWYPNTYKHDSIINRLNNYYCDKKSEGIKYVSVIVVEDAQFDKIIPMFMEELEKVDSEQKRYKIVTAEEYFNILAANYSGSQLPVFEIKPNDWTIIWNSGFHANRLNIWLSKSYAFMDAAEKLLSYAMLSGYYIGENRNDIDYAFKKILDSEHHDSHIIAETYHIGFNHLKQGVAVVKPIIKKALDCLSSRIQTKDEDLVIIVFNTQNFARYETINTEIFLDQGYTLGELREIASNAVVLYDIIEVKDTSVIICFNAGIPELGHNSYSVDVLQGPRNVTLKEEAVDSTDGFSITTEIGNRITIDRNGELVEITNSEGKSVINAGNFFTARIFDDHTLDNQTIHRSKSKFSSLIRGNVLDRIVIQGEIKGQTYQTIITLYKKLSWIDFETTFQFEEDVRIGHNTTELDEMWAQSNEDSLPKKLMLNLYSSFPAEDSYDSQANSDFVFTEKYPLFNADQWNERTNVTRYTAYYPENYKRLAESNTLSSRPNTDPNHVYDIFSRYWLDVSNQNGSVGFTVFTEGNGSYFYDGNRLGYVLAQSTKSVPVFCDLSEYSPCFEANEGIPGQYTWKYRVLPHGEKLNETDYEVAQDICNIHHIGLGFNYPLLVNVSRPINEEIDKTIPPKYTYLNIGVKDAIASALRVIDNELYLRLYEYKGKHLGEVTLQCQGERIDFQPMHMDMKQSLDEAPILTPYKIGTYQLML